MHRHTSYCVSLFSTCRATLILALALLLAYSSSSLAAPKPTNRVAIVIDSSGSYRERQAEAVDRAVALLEGMAKTELQRWEKGMDQISLISLDALPEVIWQGSLRELKSLDRKAIMARFTVRTDYAACTDVTAAFKLAARFLEGDQRYTHKYLFAFSDLRAEPPADSLRKCRKPQPIPKDFSWEALKDIQDIKVLWVPPDQKLNWQRAAQEHGLEGTFHLYTSAESGQVSIAAPPKAELNEEVKQSERRATQERLKGTFGSVLKGAALALGAVIGSLALMLAGVFLYGRRNKRSASRRNPTNRVQP